MLILMQKYYYFFDNQKKLSKFALVMENVVKKASPIATPETKKQRRNNAWNGWMPYVVSP